MSPSDSEQSKVDIKDGNLIHEGRTWSPLGIDVTFVAKSLAIAHDRDSYGGPGSRVSLNGEAFIECEGLVVVGRRRNGVRVVSLGISPESEEWLAKDFEGVAPPVGNNLPSRVHLGHNAPDNELELREEFFIQAYIPGDLFDEIIEKVRERSLESLWFSADFVGLYADFPYGQAMDTMLGLAPGRFNAEPARGRLKSIHWRERPVALAEPHWVTRRLSTDAEPALPKEHGQSNAVNEREAPRPLPSLARVEGLLSQIAVALRWVGWGLLVLTLIVAFHFR